MKISEVLGKGVTESPQLVNSTNFNLDKVQHNVELANKLLKKKSETLEDTPDYELIRTGNYRNGNFALITKGSLRKINYLVRYEAKNYSKIGNTVTQVMLWRKTAGKGTSGITKKMFFEYLLPMFGMIMSDAQQTERGKEFWENRMRDAVDSGFKVGLASLNLRQIEWFDDSMELEDWLTKVEGWGKEHKFQAKRFIISQ